MKNFIEGKNEPNEIKNKARKISFVKYDVDMPKNSYSWKMNAGDRSIHDSEL